MYPLISDHTQQHIVIIYRLIFNNTLSNQKAFKRSIAGVNLPLSMLVAAILFAIIVCAISVYIHLMQIVFIYLFFLVIFGIRKQVNT